MPIYPPNFGNQQQTRSTLDEIMGLGISPSFALAPLMAKGISFGGVAYKDLPDAIRKFVDFIMEVSNKPLGLKQTVSPSARSYLDQATAHTTLAEMSAKGKYGGQSATDLGLRANYPPPIYPVKNLERPPSFPEHYSGPTKSDAPGYDRWKGIIGDYDLLQMIIDWMNPKRYGKLP